MGEDRTTREQLRVQLESTLSLQNKVRVFAMSNLSRDNPFKPLIEQQTCQSACEIKAALKSLDFEGTP